MGFTTLDAAQLFVPVKLLIAPTGEILEQAGRGWQEQLAKSNPMGAWLPILRPVGDGLPELPGREVAVGQSWHQERQLSMPMADQKYPIQIEFTLAAPTPETSGAPFAYAGALEMADVALTVEPVPGLAVPLKLTSLQNTLQGTGLFDPQTGTLTALELRSTIESHGRGELQTGFSLDSNLTVTSQRRLAPESPAG